MPHESPYEEHWLSAFIDLFSLCRASADEQVTLLVETLSRPVNITLAGGALKQMGVPFDTVLVASKPATCRPVIRSTGASNALTGEAEALQKLHRKGEEILL